MKTLARLLGALAVLALIVMTPVAVQAAGGTGIGGTDHDFSAKGGGVGLCTFCHTPHKAITTPLLWNHTLSTNTFSWDVPATTAGTPYPTFKGDTYKGPTAKCLSCHDGSVAIGDINWWNDGKPPILDNTKLAPGDSHNIGGNGSMAGNHPVAMPYPYNQAKNSYNGVTTGNGIALNEWQNDPTSLNIRLFNDNGSGNITAGPAATKTGIECSSCHDPHNKASVDDYFLRGQISGTTTAYICLKCHIK